MAFFPEPKSFGSAHGWPAEGLPAGGGQRAPARPGGRSLRAAERRRNRRSAAAADCHGGESNGINKADSKLSDKARCDLWNNVRGSSKTARAVFQVMVSLSAQRAQPGRKGSFQVACQCRRRPVTARLGWRPQVSVYYIS